MYRYHTHTTHTIRPSAKLTCIRGPTSGSLQSELFSFFQRKDRRSVWETFTVYRQRKDLHRRTNEDPFDRTASRITQSVLQDSAVNVGVSVTVTVNLLRTRNRIKTALSRSVLRRSVHTDLSLLIFLWGQMIRWPASTSERWETRSHSLTWWKSHGSSWTLIWLLV